MLLAYTYIHHAHMDNNRLNDTRFYRFYFAQKKQKKTTKKLHTDPAQDGNFSFTNTCAFSFRFTWFLHGQCPF